MITMNVSGNLTADAIVRNVNGTDVLNFSVASNRRYKTKQGELKEETTFIYCQLWNRGKETAEVLTKGRAVAVDGSLTIRNHVGNDGVLRAFHTLRVSNFHLFGKKPAAATKPASTQPIEQPDIVNRDYPETEHPAMEDIIDDLPF